MVAAFNQNINGFNTSAVTTMERMFYTNHGVQAFFNRNINNWATGAVTSMVQTFYKSSAFSQNINGWNTGAVAAMSSTFKWAVAFNQNIKSWNTGAVATMANMFQEATAFNQNINDWDTAAVERMMFTWKLEKGDDKMTMAKKPTGAFDAATSWGRGYFCCDDGQNRNVPMEDIAGTCTTFLGYPSAC